MAHGPWFGNLWARKKAMVVYQTDFMRGGRCGVSSVSCQMVKGDERDWKRVPEKDSIGKDTIAALVHSTVNGKVRYDYDLAE